ncbi:MAG: T9SS type A sorting domain-containing protein, partial [Chitinophagaceae bacterium]|nr:T9SS type A sorting domain-containing protein [Chitinophagaceae bacterium]
KIGFVDSKAKNGNSQAEIRYSFEDKTPVNGAVVYYRLKQIDMDGKSTFSAIRNIKAGMVNAAWQVYPNPSSGSISIQTVLQGRQRLLLVNQQGAIVRNSEHAAGLLKMDGLKTGIYVLKLMGEGGGIMTRKIIVH